MIHKSDSFKSDVAKYKLIMAYVHVVYAYLRIFYTNLYNAFSYFVHLNFIQFCISLALCAMSYRY